MFISTLLRGRFIIVAALALVLATAAYGFAAANTFSAPASLGDGSEGVSGFVISNVVYTLDTGSDPANITNVSFDIAPDAVGKPDATDADVELVAGSGNLYDCAISGTTTKTASCDVTDTVTSAAVDTLRVIATSNTTTLVP